MKLESALLRVLCRHRGEWVSASSVVEEAKVLSTRSVAGFLGQLGLERRGQRRVCYEYHVPVTWGDFAALERLLERVRKG